MVYGRRRFARKGGRKAGKRKAKRGRRVRKSSRPLSRNAYQAVNKIVKKAVMKEIEWGYFDPPYEFSVQIDTDATNGIAMTPPANTVNSNTSNDYNSNHGIITEVMLAT